MRSTAEDDEEETCFSLANAREDSLSRLQRLCSLSSSRPRRSHSHQATAIQATREQAAARAQVAS